MRIDFRKGMLVMPMLFIFGPALAQDDVASLRAELDKLRAEYDARITELEQRLAIAEQNARQANAAASQLAGAPAPTAPALSRAQGGVGDSTFNPAIGVIFQGSAWRYGENPEDYSIQGFPLGGEAEPVPEGLALGETEIDISANVDDKFTAWLTAPIHFEDGEAHVDVEEAWLETLALPAGLSARFGRFFSGIGYQNSRHAHAWDFADQPLAYQALLGGQYADDGVQLRWIAPTDLYVELGAELLRGDGYPAGGAAHSGIGARSFFVNFGGDVGASHSWLAGLSFLDADADRRVSASPDTVVLFTGESQLAIADLVWKWAPNGNWKQKNFVFQAEYLWRNEDGVYDIFGLGALPYDADQRGWYAQAVYQPFPQWRGGVRIDGLAADDPGPLFAGTPLARGEDDPVRYTLMVDWSNSEFSRLRFQYAYDDAGFDGDSQWGLQYILSIGAHGAHSF